MRCTGRCGVCWRARAACDATSTNATMRADQLPPHKHGILESYRLNHAEFVRAVRAIRV